MQGLRQFTVLLEGHPQRQVHATCPYDAHVKYLRDVGVISVPDGMIMRINNDFFYKFERHPQLSKNTIPVAI